jgi:cysteinyl-tRNA synthetase
MNELLAHHNPTSIKYAILTTHYRQPIDFSNDLLKYSSNIVSKWRDFIQESTNNDLDQAFLEALEDDLNTPQALMRLQQIFNELKKSPKDKELSNYFNNGLSILGLIPHYQDLEINLDNDHIENMIARRADAKLNKNFELADQIREELLKEGIILEDTKSGTKWKKI